MFCNSLRLSVDIVLSLSTPNNFLSSIVFIYIFQKHETLKFDQRLLEIEDFFTLLATHLYTMHACLRLAVNNEIINLADFIFKYMAYIR